MSASSPQPHPHVAPHEVALKFVFAIIDDVAEIDPDAEGHALVFGQCRIAVVHCPLRRDGATDRVDDT